MTKTEQATQDVTATALSAIADTLAALKATQPQRDVNFGDTDYQERLKAERQVFPRPVFQNGLEADPAGESAETLALIAEIAPGTYLNGVVVVEVTPNGGLNFRYNNKTPDQRMRLMSSFTSFADLVRKVHGERNATAAA